MALLGGAAQQAKEKGAIPALLGNTPTLPGGKGGIPALLGTVADFRGLHRPRPPLPYRLALAGPGFASAWADVPGGVATGEAVAPTPFGVEADSGKPGGAAGPFVPEPGRAAGPLVPEPGPAIGPLKQGPLRMLRSRQGRPRSRILYCVYSSMSSSSFVSFCAYSFRRFV
jgi:hypothetical protein